MRTLFLSIFALLCCALFTIPAGAADWPDAPISLIVCYTPGGATDFQARIVSMPAGGEKYFGQPIVIVNKPGAGGMTGWNWMIERGGMDGYTMTAYNMPHLAAQSIVNKAKFTVESFEPLANWGADPAVLIVPADSPITSVKEYVDYAKANPAKLTVNGAGLYVGHHIAALQLEQAAGVKLTYIPEKGGTDAFQNVYAGTVMSGFNNLADAYRGKERVRILAIADLNRHEFLPDVPTFKELGYDIDDTSVNYRGFAFAKGVPQNIIDKAAAIVPAMFTDPMVTAKMKESGSPVKVLNREEAKKMFASQKEKLEKLLSKPAK
ncbi:MAG: tripartite tricarboxylate transporter substrate binding protein [Desulfovibrio sp.]|jgi:tripartite-type tricarboxylate transporter receptor subunit TctC|nr:tripartite tricarboxylate transporter substrate binding protein [Desulfovibrio sp.]